MHFESPLKLDIINAVNQLYGVTVTENDLPFQLTRKEFIGDLTLVVFGVAKMVKQNPEATGTAIGEWLVKNSSLVSSFNQVKGFLNISIHQKEWLNKFSQAAADKSYGIKTVAKGNPVLVEYASPNTNKPLHLGHMRNILLGYSIAEILKAAGHPVIKTNIVNDRGIHICKSMIAWKKFGNNETPQSSGLKGDHLVGKYYVEFDKAYKKEIDQLISGGMIKEVAEKKAPIMMEAYDMLRQWEQGDNETLDLWNKMNGWVYTGFDETYKTLGVNFDKIYYESQTYLLGKKIVEEGLNKGILKKKEDGSVWIDLTSEKLDEKVLLRSDGTSVYITQDLGTANLRYQDYHFSKMIYVVGNEQDYHFKVLFKTLKKLNYPWADQLNHLSYAMVDLPSGKMKSREGTVVDADDLIKEVTGGAEQMTRELGKLDHPDGEEAKHLYHVLGLGALKYYILKVDPEKRMLFNPQESIDLNGHTGPYIQYAHARIKSVLRKAKGEKLFSNYTSFDCSSLTEINHKESELLKLLLQFPFMIEEAASRLSPAVLANYAYELAKTFSQFYHEFPILEQEQLVQSNFRLLLSHITAEIISKSMTLLGIESPEKM